MAWRRSAIAVGLALSAACTTGSDLAINTACAAREQLCSRECRDGLEQSGGGMGYGQCLDACRAAAGKACRPGGASSD